MKCPQIKDVEEEAYYMFICTDDKLLRCDSQMDTAMPQKFCPKDITVSEKTRFCCWSIPAKN